MQKNSQNFSMQEALRLANSDAGQRLLALLQQSDSKKLHQAADEAASGNYDQAKQTLAFLLKNDEVQKLLKQLEG